MNGETWYIYLVSPNHPGLRRGDGTYAPGATDGRTNKIYIMENLTPSFFKKVLCHEITHAFIFSYNINLTDYTEELFADLMATYGNEIIALTEKLGDNF